MAGEWQVTSLGHLIDVKHGFAFSGEFIHDEPTGDILLTPGNFGVGGGFKGDKFKYYDGPVPEEYVLQPGDLLVTMTDLSKQSDTLGYPAFVPARQPGHRYLHNQRLGKVLVKDRTALDPRYLHYLLCSAEYRREVLASATGTTVKHTSPERIKRYRFSRPPLDEQRAIAGILGALDDKIELNRRTNATLESIARALFTSWFVDFDPVRAKAEGRQPAGMDAEIAALFPDSFEDSELGEIPTGWHIGSLLDIANLLSGGTPSTAVAEYWNGDIPWVSAKDVSRARGSFLLETEKTISRQGLENSSARILPAFTTIITARGTVGNYCILGLRMAMNQTNYGLRARNDVGDYFIFFSVAQLVEHLRQQAYGTIFDTVTTRTFRDTVTVWPPSILASHFERIAQAAMREVLHNHEQCRTLAAIRDALLPHLLAGEMPVAPMRRTHSED